MTATATKSRKQEDRSAKLMHVGNVDVLVLTTGKETIAYMLEALPATVGCGFRLTKADRGDGPGEEYDVLLDGQFSSCECKGFMRWNHCKHVESLTALVKCGKITPPPASKPQPAPKSEAQQPASRGPWCKHCNDNPEVYCSHCSL
jgi:hypothetical protein